MLYQKTIFTSERKVLRSTPEYSDAFIKRWTYVLSFLVPVLAMLIIFAAKEIYPFGDRSFLRTDLYHQYAPFTKAMKRLLSEGGSFFHTWESGLGTNFLSEYGYYLASPTNWFLILIPIDYVIEFISYLVIIKIGLCGLSMAYYLTNHHKKPDFAITLFAIFYAMSGYVAAYSWNIMWMDSIILFPIVIWAAERLVKEDKCIMYTLTLGLAILTNYYIGIMFCLFLPFYFLIQLILLQPNTIREYTSSKRIVRQQYRPNYLKKIINFAIHSLLAGGLAAVILIPVFKALFTTASSERFWIDSDFEPYFSMFDILSRQLMLTDTHQKLEHWPNIYCGVAIFLLIPMYAMNRKVRTKEKALYFGLVLFFLISFNQEILEFIWHGLHKPNSLPGRQSFIYIFILLHMSYQGWQWLKSASRAQLAGTFAFAVGFILLAEHLITQEELHWYTYYVSLLFIIIYGILCYLYQHKNLWRSSIAIIALCVVMIESCINMAVTSITSVSRSNYSQYDENFSAVLQQAEAAEDNNFYRVERVDRRTKNDGAWYDYNSASIFSSAANSSLTDLYKQFGMEGSTNSYCMTGSTWLTYMLFDIQYILSASEITTVNEDMLTLFAQEGNGYLYKNNHALSLGFITRSDLDLLCSSASSNPVDNQNEFSRYIVGQNLFVSIPANTATTSSTITVTESGYIYVYINKSSKAKTISVSSDSLNKKFENVNRGFILDLGWHEAGDTIELTCEEEGPMYVNAYRMDLDIFNQIYEELSRDQMIVDFYDNTTIKAHIDVTETGLLFTSIPADEGWIVTLNGEETEYREFGDALIAIPISETGYYEIEFHYTTPGFYTGLILSIISALFILLLFFLQHFLRQSIKIREKQQQIEINDTQRFLNELQDSLPAAEWEEILPQLNEQELALLQHPQNTESEDSVDNSDELKS